MLQCSVLVAGGAGVSALGSGALAGDSLRIAQADPDSREAEKTFWDAVKDSGDEDMLEAYLESFPHGAFAREARVKLNELRGTPGLGVPVAHPFTGKWATEQRVCDASGLETRKLMESGERLVLFGAANTAQFYGPLGYICRSVKIAGSGDTFSFAAHCKGRRWKEDQYSEGELKLDGDGKRLSGRGPDGARLILAPCN